MVHNLSCRRSFLKVRYVKKIHVLDETFEKSLSIFFESDTKTRNKNANKIEVVYPFSIIIEGPSINDVLLGGICQNVT